VVHFTVNDKGIRAANTPASFRADGPLVFGGKVAANRLGVVFDLTRGTEIGRLTFDSRVTDGISVIDPASKSIYAVPVSPKQGSSEFRIVRYDMDQFIETSDMRLTVGNNVGRPNGAAVAWNDGLAIAGAKLFIVPVSLFRNLPPPARPDLKLRNSTTSVSAGGGATPVITIEPRKTLDGVIRLALQTEVLIYNRASKTLYAAVGAEATSYPNSIVAIDPQTGVIRATAAIRGVSSPLAFSTNGQILYAGSKDTAVINRINMKTGKVETPLVPPNGAVVGPPTASYVWRARSIVAVPGRSDLVAVLWKSGVDSIVVTYDGGEPRPLIVPAEPKLRLGMLFSGDSGKTIFATAEPRLNQHLIQRLEIQDRGVTAADAVPLNFSLSLNPQFFENGWLVDGTRVFRRTGASLRQTASLDVPDPNSAQGRSGSQYRVTTVDAAGSRAFVVTQGGENALNIVAYDMRTFQPHSAGRADGLSRVNLESGASAVFAGESLAIRTRSELILFPLATLKNVPAPSPIVDELAAGFRRIRINVNSIAGDLPRGRLLASATLQSGGRGNSLLTLDPSSGTIERAYYAGSNPNRIAVSADGKSAYVALDGESRIARVNLATGERDLLFDSPVKSYAKVTDLAVGPSGTLAAVSTDGTLALFDEGRRRGGTVDFPAFRGETNRVVFDESGTTLVAYGNTFSVFRVTPEGPVYTPPPQPPAQRPELRRNVLTTAQISGGLAYSPWGDILDVARDEVVSRFVLSAQYTTIDLRNGGQRIALDTKAGRAYIAAGGNKPLILVFDLKDHNLIGARELPMSGSVLSFVQCGPDELAFQTADAIYILHISTIPLR
jgi:WD40 repeat protein